MAELERVLRTQILLRNDTAERWSQFNPVLGKGEIGYENDTNKIKIGNNVDNWNDLPYFGGEIVVDGKTIVLKDGKLSLNTEGAGSGYTLVSDGNGGFTWAKPSETTVEGLSGLISALDTRVTTAEGEIDQLQIDVKAANDGLADKADASALENYVTKEAANAYATKEEIKNHVESSVVEAINERVEAIEGAYVKSVVYTEGGKFAITDQAGNTVNIDLDVEKVVANFDYNQETEKLELTLADGTVKEVSLSAFIDVYTAAKDATEVQISVIGREISASLVNGGVTTVKVADKAITEDKLSDEVKVKLAQGAEALAALEGKADSSVVETINGVEARVTVNEGKITALENAAKEHVNEEQVNVLIQSAEIQASQVKGVVAEAVKVSKGLKVTVDGVETVYDGSEEKEIAINLAPIGERIGLVESRVSVVEKAIEDLDKAAVKDVQVNGTSVVSEGVANITSISTDMLVRGTQTLVLDCGNAE